jgi:hypothetical protein
MRGHHTYSSPYTKARLDAGCSPYSFNGCVIHVLGQTELSLRRVVLPICSAIDDLPVRGPTRKLSAAASIFEWDEYFRLLRIDGILQEDKGDGYGASNTRTRTTV